MPTLLLEEEEVPMMPTIFGGLGRFENPSEHGSPTIVWLNEV